MRCILAFYFAQPNLRGRVRVNTEHHCIPDDTHTRVAAVFSLITNHSPHENTLRDDSSVRPALFNIYYSCIFVLQYFLHTSVYVPQHDGTFYFGSVHKYIEGFE